MAKLACDKKQQVSTDFPLSTDQPCTVQPLLRWLRPYLTDLCPSFPDRGLELVSSVEAAREADIRSVLTTPRRVHVCMIELFEASRVYVKHVCVRKKA